MSNFSTLRDEIFIFIQFPLRIQLRRRPGGCPEGVLALGASGAKPPAVPSHLQN
jgi:hypothetical protein